MQTQRRKWSWWSALCAAGIGLALLAVPAWGQSAEPPQAAAVILPEPDPFSDRYPVEIQLISAQDLELLYQLQIDIDAVRAGQAPASLIATVYVNPQEATLLERAGLTATPIPNESLRAFYAYGPGSGAPGDWPTFEEMVQRMQNLAEFYPDLLEMYSIGHSVQGRDMWCLKITDNPGLQEDEPEFKYSSTMHGDEITGVELTLRLAELLVSSYGSDPDLTYLVDEVEIWLCPIYNPDGYVIGSRYNANGEDLNRDFPDPIVDPYDDPIGREPETQVFMNFGYAQRFAMGANYHGGALVVNYPWDAEGHNPPDSPDNDLFYDYSVGYAIRNPMIWNADWPGPVIQGWHWYTIYGGLQDWAYVWRGEHHVTIEVSEDKNPPYLQMDAYWDDNQEAMIWWLERALTGVRGLVTDAVTGAPLDAVVTVEAMNAPNSVRTDAEVGDYHRLIGPGDYDLTASASGYYSQTLPVTVTTGTATVQDFALQPLSMPEPDLSPSSKLASQAGAQPGQALEYRVVLVNAGIAANAKMTDTLPAEVTWSGYLSATAGTPAFVAGQVRWTGELAPGAPVTVTAGVTVDLCLAGGTEILNRAELEDSLGLVLTRTATTTVLNAAPSAPGLLSPADGAAGQPLEILLEWAASVDLNCDPLSYAVAFGTENPPPVVASGLAGTTYDPGPLAAHTTYYWQVSASDGTVQSASPVWIFSTLNRAPDLPQAVSPPDGASGVGSAPLLSWQAGDPDGDALSYTLAFGPSDPPPVAATGLITPSYQTSALLPDATYYWMITASDGISQTAGTTWSFTTLSAERLFLPLAVRANPPRQGESQDERRLRR